MWTWYWREFSKLSESICFDDYRNHNSNSQWMQSWLRDATRTVYIRLKISHMPKFDLYINIEDMPTVTRKFLREPTIFVMDYDTQVYIDKLYFRFSLGGQNSFLWISSFLFHLSGNINSCSNKKTSWYLKTTRSIRCLLL